MNSPQETGDTLFCPVCGSADVAEQIKHGGAVIYQCQNCSVGFDVFGEHV